MRSLLFLLAVGFSRSSAIAEDSPSFRGNPDHPGIYDSKPIHAAPGVKWKFATKSQVLASPAVVNGVLYIGSADHRLYAIDTETGTKKWEFKAEGRYRLFACCRRWHSLFL